MKFLGPEQVPASQPGAAPRRWVRQAGAARPEDARFVFHDPAGRRWSRIKRVALAVLAALVVLSVAVIAAVALIAPGRAPLFSGTAPQPVVDWQLRGPGSAPAPTAADGA